MSLNPAKMSSLKDKHDATEVQVAAKPKPAKKPVTAAKKTANKVVAAVKKAVSKRKK